VNIQTQFIATGTFADASQQDLTQSVTWTSAPVGIATISNIGGTKGAATGVSVGSAIVTASFGGLAGTASLSVNNATLTSIAISPNNGIISAGGSEQFTATGTFSGSSPLVLNGQVSWSSSNIGVAVISDFGLANAAGTGTTDIKATLNGVTGTTSLTVQ
jgi:hypothetical protein